MNVTKCAKRDGRFSLFVSMSSINDTIHDIRGLEEGVTIDLFHSIPEWKKWSKAKVVKDSPFRFLTPIGGREGRRCITFSPAFCKQYFQVMPDIDGFAVSHPLALDVELIVAAATANRSYSAQGLEVTTDIESHVATIQEAIARLRKNILPDDHHIGHVQPLAQAVFGGHLNKDGQMKRRRKGAMLVLQSSSTVPEGKIVLHPELYRQLFEDLLPEGPMVVDDSFFGPFRYQALLSPGTCSSLKGDEDGDLVFITRWRDKCLVMRYPITPSSNGKGGLQICEPMLPSKSWTTKFYDNVEGNAGELGSPVTYDHGLTSMIKAVLEIIGIKRAMGPTDRQESQVKAWSDLRALDGHAVLKELGVEKYVIQHQEFLEMVSRGYAFAPVETVHQIWRDIAFGDNRIPSMQEIAISLLGLCRRPDPRFEESMNTQLMVILAGLRGFHEFTDNDICGLELFIRGWQATPPSEVREQSAALQMLHAATAVRSAGNASNIEEFDISMLYDNVIPEGNNLVLCNIVEMLEEKGSQATIDQACFELKYGIGETTDGVQNC